MKKIKSQYLKTQAIDKQITEAKRKLFKLLLKRGDIARDFDFLWLLSLEQIKPHLRKYKVGATNADQT